jgi:hypothetical protein
VLVDGVGPPPVAELAASLGETALVPDGGTPESGLEVAVDRPTPVIELGPGVGALLSDSFTCAADSTGTLADVTDCPISATATSPLTTATAVNSTHSPGGPQRFT